MEVHRLVRLPGIVKIARVIERQAQIPLIAVLIDPLHMVLQGAQSVPPGQPPLGAAVHKADVLGQDLAQRVLKIVKVRAAQHKRGVALQVERRKRFFQIGFHGGGGELALFGKGHQPAQCDQVGVVVQVDPLDQVVQLFFADRHRCGAH